MTAGVSRRPESIRDLSLSAYIRERVREKRRRGFSGSPASFTFSPPLLFSRAYRSHIAVFLPLDNFGQMSGIVLGEREGYTYKVHTKITEPEGSGAFSRRFFFFFSFRGQFVTY